MKLLKSKDAAAAVDIKSWPIVMDTGQLCAQAPLFAFYRDTGSFYIVFCFPMAACRLLLLSLSPRWPPQEEESSDLQAPDPRDVGLPRLQCVYNRNPSGGQSTMKKRPFLGFLCGSQNTKLDVLIIDLKLLHLWVNFHRLRQQLCRSKFECSPVIHTWLCSRPRGN